MEKTKIEVSCNVCKKVVGIFDPGDKLPGVVFPEGATFYVNGERKDVYDGFLICSPQCLKDTFFPVKNDEQARE